MGGSWPPWPPRRSATERCLLTETETKYVSIYTLELPSKTSTQNRRGSRGGGGGQGGFPPIFWGKTSRVPTDREKQGKQGKWLNKIPCREKSGNLKIWFNIRENTGNLKISKKYQGKHRELNFTKNKFYWKCCRSRVNHRYNNDQLQTLNIFSCMQIIDDCMFFSQKFHIRNNLIIIRLDSLKIPQNHSERSHFQIFFGINAALYISSSGKNQGKLREFHSGFPVGTLNKGAKTTHTEKKIKIGQPRSKIQAKTYPKTH